MHVEEGYMSRSVRMLTSMSIEAKASSSGVFMCEYVCVGSEYPPVEGLHGCALLHRFRVKVI